MNVKNFKNKTSKEIKQELLSISRELFNLKIQLNAGQLKQTHLLKTARKNIARIKTILSQKNILQG
ncbi:50S ribosomal protein L29 [Enterobacteriaceae endosymbiont of Neohaemonia nigricornis]|uniref:50S ribosomal protein L29 n=1 Tax=Enterobacteriaceae endosymbiont of Neohaemonia nigricornis TaxID=2675792 RepID=UPI001448E6F2|nr:50S ribosomal protein L29 [Enterobacteriaceae endosymbiont of Neohaemonia nigricornis]QJC30462.1 50S ribosomal protein L29 [Enterobacteriaceae endosymbiont of Neohaemonia nigricornis]